MFPLRIATISLRTSAGFISTAFARALTERGIFCQKVYLVTDENKLGLHIRFLKWHWCTRLKSNRLVDPDNSNNRSVSDIEIPSRRKSCAPETIRFHQGVQDCSLRQGARILGHRYSGCVGIRQEIVQGIPLWNIEEYHRGIKQCCGIERCQDTFKKRLFNEAIFCSC